MTVDAALLASAFAAAGAPIWAAIIQGIIQVLKMVPQFKSVLDGREKLTCFALALVVVLMALWAAASAVPPTMTIDALGILTLVLSWFAIARLAMTVYDDFVAKGPSQVVEAGERPTQSVLHAKGWSKG